jgi:pimeloyl-ACP methyl ester carboxylesterase
MPESKGFAKVNGTRLYYEVAGTGSPLVLIHGFACDTTYWDDQFEVFAQYFKVIRYDMRGFGQSDNPTEQTYSHFDDLKALLDDLGIARAHIVGWSAGCRMALNFALAYPDMTHSLVLFGGTPSGFEWPQEVREKAQKVFVAAYEAAQTSGVEAANEVFLQVPPLKVTLQNPEAAPRITNIIMNYPGWHWFHDDPEVELDPPALERLEQVKAPTCIIVGEKDHAGALIGAKLMKERIPNAQLFVIPDTGHAVNMEAPQQFNEIVLRFLAKV